jgi:hypothetical protein
MLSLGISKDIKLRLAATYREAYANALYSKNGD